MAATGKAVLGFLGGGIVSALVTFFGGAILGDLANISQAEGAYAMSLAFFWAPAAFLVGGVLTAMFLTRKKNDGE